ncbi:NifB/NifX family molybdenum-iron cluster-binding protein [Candidatus Bathyarchaeota archaeon]|nr:NifB/NifX family molybdenum-iron cluster-binding protein [Candidatus Bathyarchaeota archaeon]MBS7613867.1 NifB/NifX family molybdenum-iron cluster-binding protein [Candidatus Bathyarchaeota archaeon]MBS7617883.1 NifB/NifX family molybdenum-iron cluster-binding protein [Candidatus Bathyarchaeota archaeon]
MRRLKIAIPTKDHMALEDTVSEVFGKAKTFTIVECEDGKIVNVQIVDNTAASYDYGSGPIVVKILAGLKVDLVLAVEIGPGVSKMLEHNNIQKVLVESGRKVKDILEESLTDQSHRRQRYAIKKELSRLL